MQYIAFFRGINVGGRNIVKMNDLKQLFLELGFATCAHTYKAATWCLTPLNRRTHRLYGQRLHAASALKARCCCGPAVN